MAGSAGIGREKSQDWNPGLLHGRFLAFRTVATVPDRVGAVATFHGANLVANLQRWAAKSKAQFLIAIAASDDKQAPN